MILKVKNKNVFVDKEDYLFLKRFIWTLHYTGYAYTRIIFLNKRRNLSMHRIIMLSQYHKNKECDHINRNKLDNRKRNLRLVYKIENIVNRQLQSNNSTGYKGVCFLKKNKKFVAYAGKKPRKYLGSFKTAKQAAKAYNTFAKKYYGKFACLNKIYP